MGAAEVFGGVAFREFPVIGILRGFSRDLAVGAASSAAEAGLTAIEVTMDSPAALETIAALRRALPESVAVGAGTVTSEAAMRQALGAGAAFMVTPVVVPDVIAACRTAGVPVFPGAMTPTEVLTAWRLGATMVKLFPAGPLGPEYMQGIRAPLGDVPLLPTGGIGLDNVAAFRRAGAAGFGIGGPLFDGIRVAARDWDWLRLRVLAFRGVLAPPA